MAFPTPIIKINGSDAEMPRNWLDFSVLATFDKSSIQANITTNQLEFVNDEAQTIIDWFEAGLNPNTTQNGCYQGLPIELGIQQNGILKNAFTGIIDFTDDFEITNSVNVKAKIKSLTGLNIFDEQTQGVSFELLKEKGAFTSADYIPIPYFEEHDYSDLEILMMYLTLFILLKSTYETTLAIANAIANTSGSLAGIVTTILQVTALIAYLVILLAQIVELIKQIKETVYPTKRYFNGVILRTALTRIAEFFGLKFESSIEDLEKYAFLPSQTDRGERKFDKNISGLPSFRDDGYIVSNFLSIVKDIFYAKFVINQDTLYLEPLANDNFWLNKLSPLYVQPSKLIEYRKYNISDLKGSELISFATDPNESFTVKNYSGTTIEIRTRQNIQATVGTALQGVNVTNPNRVELLKGVNDLKIPWALGTRRSELTNVEKIFNFSIVTAYNLFVATYNGIVGTFGGQKQNKISTESNRINTLKVSQSNFDKPKLLRVTLESSSGDYLLKSNYRSELNTEYLWDNYHADKSFVEGVNGEKWRNQWRIYTDEIFDFSFSDFVSLINNAYFYTFEGKVARAEKFEWNFGRGSAKLTYRVREPYNKNLNERRFK